MTRTDYPMHVTSEYYRRTGASRIDFVFHSRPTGPAAAGVEPSLRHSPLRPSSETLQRLAQLHHRQSYSHRTV